MIVSLKSWMIMQRKKVKFTAREKAGAILMLIGFLLVLIFGYLYLVLFQ